MSRRTYAQARNARGFSPIATALGTGNAYPAPASTLFYRVRYKWRRTVTRPAARQEKDMQSTVRRTLVNLGLALLLTTTLAPAASAADSRCSFGAGVSVYENINLGGSTAPGCSVGWYRADFSQWTTNLGFFANWNDRISSYQTFNFTGHTVKFWTDPSRNGSVIITTNNSTVNNVDDYGNFNDRFSSGQITS